MVDDPSANPELFPTEKAQEKERQRLFKIIEDLVLWENTTNEEVLEWAWAEIWQSWRRACAENADHLRAKELFDRNKLPAFHDPFAGGGSLPLEAQRLGLEAYASDLTPVAVLINKAMIEIPPNSLDAPRSIPSPARTTASWNAPGKEPGAWPRTSATTASGCVTRPRSASATSTPRWRSPRKWSPNARAKNTSVSGLVEANILVSKAGKVRLFKPEELPQDWDPDKEKRLTVWEMVHHLIRELESAGEQGAAKVLAKLGARGEPARELAYRLYTLYERKKRAAEALSYNSLVQSWPDIMQLAQEYRKTVKGPFSTKDQAHL